MNGRMLKSGLAALALATLGGSLMAHDDGDRERDDRFVVRADLEGFQEVPAISTVASGRFRAWVDTKANTITWKLNYDGLEGDVQQAHVHFGQLSRQRRRQLLPVQQPGKWPRRDRYQRLSRRDRPNVIGLIITPGSASSAPPARASKPAAIRRNRGRHPQRHRLRQRPLDQVAGRRNPRSAALIRA